MPSLDEHARSHAVLSALGVRDRVDVNELAEQSDVSTVTSRTGLDVLEQRVAPRRVRGEAVAALERAGTRVHLIDVPEDHR